MAAMRDHPLRGGRSPPGSGWELAIWYLIRLCGLALFVLALAHFSITHFVFDVTVQEADWVLDERWSEPPLADRRLAHALAGHLPQLHGRPDGRRRLHPRRPPHARSRWACTSLALVLFAMGTMVVATLPFPVK